MDVSNPNEIAGKTEHSQQVALMAAVAQYANEQPALRWLHAIPNGGDRNRVVAANLKAEGVRSGVSDLFLPSARRGYHGFYIEMKNAKGTESQAQIAFATHVASEGYLYLCAHSWHEAFRALMWYLDFQHHKLWELPE